MKEREKKGLSMRRLGFRIAAAAAGAAAPVAAVTGQASSVLAATTPVAGTTTTFDKYIVMKRNANVPNATFSYTISAPSDPEMSALANPEDTNGTNLTVRKGIGAPTVSSTTFNAGDKTFDDVQKGRPNKTSTTYTDQQNDDVDGLDKTKKYAKKTATVDFSGVNFSEPGVYRYKITENASGEKGITEDKTARFLDVYVTSDETGKLAIGGYVFHTLNAAQPKGTTAGSNNPDGKNKGFTNQYATSDITLSKKVTGNQGYKDQYFRFHVDVTDLDAGARMFVTDGAGSRTAYKAADTVAYEYDKDTGTRTAGQKRFVAQTGAFTDVTAAEGSDADMAGLALTADDKGKASFDVYLKDGETVRLNGLTAGAKYTIKETSEDYSATATKAVAGTDGATAIKLAHAAADHSDTTPENVLSANDETVAFTNDRTGTLPTGLVHNNRAALSVAGIAAAGACIAIAVKKRNDRAQKAESQE